MFISQLDVNRALNDHFVTSGVLNIAFFNESLQLVLDNTRYLYESMYETSHNPRATAFCAFAELASDILHDEYGDFNGGYYDYIARWCDHFGGFNEVAKATIDYIISERAEAQREKEADTMNNTEINSTNITNDNEKEEGTMENIITCEHCGCVIENTYEAHEVDGNWYCDDCFNEKYTYCDSCGEIIELDDAHWYNGDAYCEDCFDENYAYCHHCGEAYPIDDMIEIEGDMWCEDCRDEHFTLCERCEEWVRDYGVCVVHVDEDGSTETWCDDCANYYARNCEDCGEVWHENLIDDCGLCPDCARAQEQNTRDINDWCAPRGVRSYSYKPDPCMCYTDDDEGDITYGFELEADKAPSETDLNDLANFVNDNSGYTYVKHDGSLSNGMEIVSHPATIAYHMSKKDTWEMIFNELISSGLKSHDAKTCGLHVHIGIKELEEQNDTAANNMLFLMDHYWDKFVKFSRRTESQLESWARRYGKFHGDYKEWKKQAKDTRNRYYALNFQNKHTIEIRMFRGTLNLETFFATLQFVDVLTRKCIEITELSELQSISWEELIESDWPELNAYLKKRGLAGTEEEIAAAQAEEAAKLEEAERRRNATRTIGARVLVVRPVDREPRLVGCEGTVIQVGPWDDGERLDVAVQFDEGCNFDRLHDVCGLNGATYSRCWRCESRNLEPVEA